MDHYTVGDALVCMIVLAILFLPFFMAIGGDK